MVAQEFPSDSLFKELKRFLVEKKESEHPELYSDVVIWNLITMKCISFEKDTSQVSIFSFEGMTIPSHIHVFIKNNNEYYILDMGDWYKERTYLDILSDLVDYFKTHDIDKYLLPAFNKAVYDIHMKNQQMPEE